MSVTNTRGAPAPQAEPLRRRPSNSVPQLPEWQERVIRGIAVVTLAYWTYYIIWRWGWTLNPDALWFSIPLALAETWGLVTAFVMIHSVWRIRHRQPIPAPPGMTVDVYITCYDEPLEVIRRTAIGARAIRYPHKTYILDDGERDEVQAMAQELGLGYIRRTTHEHAKAGNLNNALKYTDGDLHPAAGRGPRSASPHPGPGAGLLRGRPQAGLRADAAGLLQHRRVHLQRRRARRGASGRSSACSSG